jgi:hypothetical protein
LLNNLRKCKILEDDFKLLKTRFLSNLKINLFEYPWNEASYIVPRNDLKDAINDHIIEYYIQKDNKRYCIIVAEDSYNNSLLLGYVQFEIRQTYSSKKTQNLHSFLKLFKGMKVVLIENQFPTLGLVNGTIGTTYEIIFDHDVSKNDSVFIRPPLHILVDFNSFINDHKSSLNDIMIEGLPKNIVPIAPISKSFDYIYEIKGP